MNGWNQIMVEYEGMFMRRETHTNKGREQNHTLLYLKTTYCEYAGSGIYASNLLVYRQDTVIMLFEALCLLETYYVLIIGILTSLILVVI